MEEDEVEIEEHGRMGCLDGRLRMIRSAAGTVYRSRALGGPSWHNRYYQSSPSHSTSPPIHPTIVRWGLSQRMIDDGSSIGSSWIDDRLLPVRN